MKDQFFADERDFMKYDLWIELARYLGDSASVTFIPMLTRNDATKQGGKTRYDCGKRNPRLYAFLRHCLDSNNRRIVRLRDFFRKHPQGCYYPYLDDGSKCGYFRHEGRQAYFTEIRKRLLSDAVILIDPDNGLETRGPYWKKNPEKYVRYSEVAELARRSTGKRAILVIQFCPKGANAREKFLRCHADKLRKPMDGWNVRWLAPKTGNGKVGDVAFFVLSRFADRMVVSRFMRNYGQRHQMITDCGGRPASDCSK